MASKLIPTLQISGCSYHINIHSDAVIGVTKLLVNPNEIPDISKSLHDGLVTFINQYSHGVLTKRRYSIAIAAQSQKNWLFDSHSRGPKGFVAPKKGRAMLMSFSSIDLLNQCILYLLTKSDEASNEIKKDNPYHYQYVIIISIMSK